MARHRVEKVFSIFISIHNSFIPMICKVARIKLSSRELLLDVGGKQLKAFLDFRTYTTYERIPCVDVLTPTCSESNIAYTVARKTV